MSALPVGAMLRRFAESTPLDLGAALPPDPFAVQPGSILFHQFCVISRVRHGAVGWRVGVTDLRRRLGDPPHHRLDLVALPCAVRHEAVIRRAMPAFQVNRRRIHGSLMLGDHHLGLLVTPSEASPRPPQPSPDRQRALALTASRIFDELHQRGVVGWRPAPSTFRLDAQGSCQIADWTTLLGLRRQESPGEEDIERDVEALEELLEALGVPASTVRDWRRTPGDLARHFSPDPNLPRSPASLRSLPAIPPFVGRQGALRAIHDTVARSREAGPAALAVVGERGSGRSRLLQRAADDLQRGEHLLLLHLSPGPVAEVLSSLAEVIELVPRQERAPLLERIGRALGPLVGLLGGWSDKLASLVGRKPPPPSRPLTPRVARDVAAAAAVFSAVGTPERPLVLLVDDADRADTGLRGMLRQLLAPGRTHHTALVVTQVPGTVFAGACARDLPPLDVDPIRTLVRRALPGSVDGLSQIAEELCAASGGHPSRIWEELQRAVAVGHLRQTKAGTWVSDPGWPTHAPDAFISQLPPPDVLRVGALLAVEERSATEAWLQRITRWSEHRTMRAVEGLIEQRAAYREADGSLRLVGARVQPWLLAQAEGDLLALAHRDVAAWYGSAGPTSISRHAWHLEHAEDLGPDEPLGLLHLEAGTHCLRALDAYRARWHFERALGRTTERTRRARAHEGRADALLLVDQPDEALSAYLTAMASTGDVHRSLQIADRAAAGLSFVGARRALWTLADKALGRLQQRLPRSMLEAGAQALGALVSRLRARRNPDAQALSSLHATLASSAAPVSRAITLSSVLRGWAATAGRSPAAARLRAIGATMLAELGWTHLSAKLLDSAEDTAREAASPDALGLVHQARAQSLFRRGRYREGQRALDASLEELRRAGDRVGTAQSLLWQVVHALDRETTDALLARLDEASAAAFAQPDGTVAAALDGLRRWVLARAGRWSPPRVTLDDPAPAASDAAGAPSILADAATALALDLVERPVLAQLHAERALARLDARPLEAAPRALAHLAAARVAVSTASDRASHRRARALVRKLRRQRYHDGLLGVAVRVVEARLRIAEGAVDAARRLLSEVVGTAERHQERWHVWEAHRLLAGLVGGLDAPAARAHQELADQLRAELTPPHEPASPSVLASPTPSVEPDAGHTGTSETRVDRAVEALEDMVSRYLGERSLVARARADLRTPAPVELVQLLLVNLVLAASDAATGDHPIHLAAEPVAPVGPVEPDGPSSHASELAGPGPWLSIRVKVDGPRGAGAHGVLAECGALCKRMGGRLAHGDAEAVDFVAWLPASPSTSLPSSGTIAVFARERGVQRTLVEGLRRMGFVTQVVPPDEPLSEDVIGLLHESALQFSVPDHVWTLEVVPRRSGWTRGRQLPFPFLVSELQELLGPYRTASGESAGG